MSKLEDLTDHLHERYRANYKPEGKIIHDRDCAWCHFEDKVHDIIEKYVSKLEADLEAVKEELEVTNQALDQAIYKADKAQAENERLKEFVKLLANSNFAYFINNVGELHLLIAKAQELLKQGEEQIDLGSSCVTCGRSEVEISQNTSACPNSACRHLTR